MLHKITFRLFEGKQVEMVQYQITPDREAHNRKVHDLFRSLSTLYVSPLDQLRGKVKGAFWWDIVITRDGIRYYATFPAEWQREVLAMMSNTWEGCSIERVETLATAMPAASDVCEMKYRRSDLFALKVDNRMEHEPMDSILSVVADLQDGDIARYSVCAEPISRLDWQDHAERLHQQFRDGRTPKRRRITKKDAFISVGELVTAALQSLSDLVDKILGYDEQKGTKSDDREKRLLMLDGLSRGTVNKMRMPTLNTHIRIAAHSDDPGRKRVIMRTISNSFNDLTAENELERHDYHYKMKPVIMRELNTYRISWPTKLDIDKNKMSNEELGRLVEVPSAYLQDKYEEIDAMDTRQIDVPATLTEKGISIGTVTYKKQTREIYFPVKDWDQLCLPSCVIGGMGSGKTKAFACNRAIGYVEAGYSAVIFDPKKSEVWDQIEAGLPKEKRQRILLGDAIMSLDFREALHSKSARNRLAQILIKFFEDNSDSAGAQTQRFLKAAVFGMRTGRLEEIVKIFTDAKYREKTIETMPEGMHRLTLQQFHQESAARQNQIIGPVWNRLDVILGDEYLERCMRATSGIDMVELLSKRGMCTVFDMPDHLNSREAKDILVNLLSFKIDLAMGLRKDLFPVAVIYDEPHQYLRSADVWKKAAVESRAYRLSYHWLFHSWEQIPASLAQIIKDAGAHYYLYPSSERTYNGLKRIIDPFTVEEGIATKRFHAICALKVGDKRITPLMVHMKAPLNLYQGEKTE